MSGKAIIVLSLFYFRRIICKKRIISLIIQHRRLERILEKQLMMYLFILVKPERRQRMSHSFELLLGTEWRDCGTTGCGSGFNDHLYRYVSQRYKVNERLTGWIWFQCADTFTFRQMTCLNFHLPRCRRSTMPPTATIVSNSLSPCVIAVPIATCSAHAPCRE